MAGDWAPELHLHETNTGCQLVLVGLTHGQGTTLQEAADDLVTRLLGIILTIRASRAPIPPGLGHLDRRTMIFCWELAELACRGEDIRGRLFGQTESHDDSTA